MRILNLFAGIGGNRTLWGDKHEITAIEHNQQIAMIYQRRFPNDRIIIGDAYEYNLWNYDKFDFIWASPPCQTHSWANNWLHVQGCRRYPNFRMYELITYLLVNANRKNIPFVVENVKPQYDKYIKKYFLIKPTFKIGRHYFWSNINLPDNHFEISPITILNAKSTKRRTNEEYINDLCEWHHINKELIDFLQDKNWGDHDLKGQVLRNCVKPEIGKYILDQVINQKQNLITKYI